jgi:hypothetical protein
MEVWVLTEVCDNVYGKRLPEIQWRNHGERRGGHYEKRNGLPAPGSQIMLYAPDTMPNFLQVITVG